MNKKLTKLFLSMILMFVLVMVFMPTEVEADIARPTVDGEIIYGNGYPLIITAGDNEGTTVYWDKNGNGLGDDEEKLTDATNKNLSVYTIYGGSESAKVTTGTSITMTGGKVSAVYGGGFDIGATVQSTKVTISGGEVNSVYGGGIAGAVTGSTNVTITGDANIEGSVNGGGFDIGATVQSTKVTISGGEVNSVYGGGLSGAVTGSTNVTITGDANIEGSVNGGGLFGDVEGGATVTIMGTAKIEGSVNGCGSSSGTTVQSTIVTITGDANIKGNVYGGGIGAIAQSTTVIISGDAKIEGSVYGGGRHGAVTGSANVTISGGTVNYIYGGGENNGATVQSTNVTISGDANVINSVYGGGDNGAVTGSTNVEVSGGIVHNVCGGGRHGAVEGGATVTIMGTAKIEGSVYGGGDNGAVTGSTNVTITGDANIEGHVYGGGLSGAVEGGATVTIMGTANIVHSVYGGGLFGAVEGGATVTIMGTANIGSSVYGGGFDSEATVMHTNIIVSGSPKIGGVDTTNGNNYGIMMNSVEPNNFKIGTLNLEADINVVLTNATTSGSAIATYGYGVKPNETDAEYFVFLNEDPSNTTLFLPKVDVAENRLIAYMSPRTSSKEDAVISPETTMDSNSGETKIEVTLKPTDTGKNTEAEIKKSDMEEIVDRVITAAADTQTTPKVEINIETSDRTESVEITLPAGALDTLAKNEDAKLTVKSDIGTVEFDVKALETIIGEKEDETPIARDIVITIAKTDVSDLNKKQQERVGDRTVYDLTVTRDGEVVRNFEGGKATITLPYTPTEEEIGKKVVVFYVDDNGNLHRRKATYDKETGTITFETKSFSIYMVDSEAMSPTEKFSDVNDAQWYTEAVEFVYDNSIMSGVSENTFAPQETATRAMIWTVLARMAGEDVIDGVEWYSKAQDWSKNEGVSDGTDPNGNITREQFVTMLYRYEAPEMATTQTLLGQFTDESEISEYAVSAMEWAVAEGIITGKTENTLDPKGYLTRAEMATILSRFTK